MKLHELENNLKKKSKRVGRGPGSGLGKTSGRGQKGQKSRSGASIPATFEGGQLPLFKALPKRGFKNKFRIEYSVVNVSDLNIFNDGDTVDAKSLLEKGLISKKNKPIKILGDGELNKKLKIKADKFSESAKVKIANSGSTIEVK